jgi:putative transposase
MTNHVHLLLTPRESASVSRCMQYVGRYYVRYFNHRHCRSGTLFDGRFRSSIVQTRRYFLACQRYIELNPVRAGMVHDPADYSWSSYQAHAFGRAAKMWRPHAEYLALGQDQRSRTAAYRALFAQAVPARLMSDIREALDTGLALGSEQFRQEVEQLTGQRQQLFKRGPRPA